MKINKAFLATIAAAAVLGVDGPIAQAAVFVRTAPPPPRAVGVVGRSPGRGFVWTDGYWRWGGQAQRVCMDPRQVATSAPCRCSMGCAQLALWPWRMDFRRGPLALN